MRFARVCVLCILVLALDSAAFPQEFSPVDPSSRELPSVPELELGPGVSCFEIPTGLRCICEEKR